MEIFDSWNNEYKNPFGAVPAHSPVLFTLKAPPGLGVWAARLVVTPDGGEPLKADMQKADKGFSLSFAPAAPGLYGYYFELDTEKGLKYILHGGKAKGVLADSDDGRCWQLTVYSASLDTPEWLKGGVMYQVFPDRFRREGSLPENLPKDRILRGDWYGVPEYRPDDDGRIFSNTYFGGNLAGITSKLGYLRSLGVNVLYLNPIFEAHSNHRYNTADYLKIDPLLGDEEDFRNLCREAGKYGIRVILDGVFNHTGDDSVYFNRTGRYGEGGAYRSRESPYSKWYTFQKWSDEYACWWNFKTLPDVNEMEPSYLAFIMGPGGVLEHWLEAGASGWRLDVADELPEAFLLKLRQTVKHCKPEAAVIGEVWEDASNKVSYGKRRHYLEGAELDSVMNYPLRQAILAFLKGGDAQELCDAEMTLLENYPKPVVDVLMNLLGSHDTQRLITALAGESGEGHDRAWKAREALAPERKTAGERLVKLALALQFFLPGVPCVYYGDEAGLEGYEDPFCRRCFPWGRENERLVNTVRRFSAIRRACPALKSGSFRCLAANGGLFAFARTEGGESLICAVNRGKETESLQPPEDGSNYELVSGDEKSGFWDVPAGLWKLYGAGKWVCRIAGTAANCR